MKTTLAAAFSALFLGSVAALAQSAEGPWTMEEFVATHPEVTPEVYVQIDTNGDGLIDVAELEAAVAAGLVTPTEG